MMNESPGAGCSPRAPPLVSIGESYESTTNLPNRNAGLFDCETDLAPESVPQLPSRRLGPLRPAE